MVKLIAKGLIVLYWKMLVIIVMLCQPSSGGREAQQCCDVTELATWRRSPVSVSVWSSSVRGGPDQQLPDLIIGCPAPRAPPLPESQAGVHGAKQIQLEVRQSRQQLSGATSLIVIVVVGEREREGERNNNYKYIM